MMERRHHYSDPPEFPCSPLPPHEQSLWGLWMVADGGLDEENFDEDNPD